MKQSTQEGAKFKVGDKVRWTSQAAGHTKTKEGRIVAVVPRKMQCKYWRDGFTLECEALLKKGGVVATSVKSMLAEGISDKVMYLVVVKVGKRAKPRLYKPVPSKLELAFPLSRAGKA